MKKEKEVIVLPAEVLEMAQGVSNDTKSEVQNVLNKVFSGVEKMKKQLLNVSVEDENDVVGMELARTIRLSIRRERLEAEKTFDFKRSEVQAKMLSFKTEDSLWLKSKQIMQITTKELEEKALYLENTGKRILEEKLKLRTAERALKVREFNTENSEIPQHEFENMSEESFELFLNGLKSAYIAKIEKEKKEEEERLLAIKKQEKEREKQRLENERLKREAEKREREILKEKEGAEKEIKAIELKFKKEREEIERKALKEKEKQDAILQAEKEKRERLELELKAKKEAEIKAENERKEKELRVKKEAERLAKAPIKKQMTAWIDSFIAPEKTIENELSDEILEKFNSFKNWAKTQIEKL